jgi:bifunctional non-homologous end joining protein LigD
MGFVEPCLPSVRATAPHGREWVHEIKHDGYRLIVRRDGKRGRIFTRRGFDWTGRFPWIEDALCSLRVQSATLDGEAVVCGRDGVTDFEKPHSRVYDHQVFLYALDLLELTAVVCALDTYPHLKNLTSNIITSKSLSIDSNRL